MGEKEKKDNCAIVVEVGPCGGTVLFAFLHHLRFSDSVQSSVTHGGTKSANRSIS